MKDSLFIRCFVAACSWAINSSAGELTRDPEDVSLPAAGTAAGQRVEVVVGPRETLGAIARRFGIGVAELCAANGITNPDRVRAGQRLVVPRPGGAPVAGRASAAGRPAMAGAARAVVSDVEPLVALSRPGTPLAPTPFDSIEPLPEVPQPPAEPLVVLTDVYGLRELARAPEASGRLTVRVAPAVARPAVGASRFERMGAVIEPRPTARAAALKLFSSGE